MCRTGIAETILLSTTSDGSFCRSSILDLGNYYHNRVLRWAGLAARMPSSRAPRQLQGSFDFSEGISAKWIFDVEIEKLRAYIFLHVEKTKIMLDELGKILLDWLRTIFYNTILIFPEFNFLDFLPTPHQNIYISAK
jgi:hypothetical protein